MHTRRNRLRCRWFDYSRPRSYFVTLCVNQRLCLFGGVSEDTVVLNDGGLEVERTWRAIAERFDAVRIGVFVVMPNHLHGLLRLEPGARALPDLVGWFKAESTLRYGRGVRLLGWPAFDTRLWQRSYYDRVIRDDEERLRAEGYIIRNPRMWALDPNHPRAR